MHTLSLARRRCVFYSKPGFYPNEWSQLLRVSSRSPNHKPNRTEYILTEPDKTFKYLYFRTWLQCFHVTSRALFVTFTFSSLYRTRSIPHLRALFFFNINHNMAYCVLLLSYLIHCCAKKSSHQKNLLNSK